MARTMKPLDELEITNQCVLVCDLGRWNDPASSAWTRLSGSQDDVGRRLAALLEASHVTHLDDFGGVCETLLCEGEQYLVDPPRVKSGGAVFSFTPKKRVLAEASEMARVSALAGYALLVLTLQKHDKYGKVWVLIAALRHLQNGVLAYFEDTNSVIDELKSAAEGAKISAVHVLAPGFEEHRSQFADRVISQAEYRQEVLE
jgi:hypothetical protein